MLHCCTNLYHCSTLTYCHFTLLQVILQQKRCHLLLIPSIDSRNNSNCTVLIFYPSFRGAPSSQYLSEGRWILSFIFLLRVGRWILAFLFLLRVAFLICILVISGYIRLNVLPWIYLESSFQCCGKVNSSVCVKLWWSIAYYTDLLSSIAIGLHLLSRTLLQLLHCSCIVHNGSPERYKD